MEGVPGLSNRGDLTLKSLLLDDDEDESKFIKVGFFDTEGSGRRTRLSRVRSC